MAQKILWKLSLISFIIFTVSCSDARQQQYDAISAYFLAKHKLKLNNTTKAIFVLTDSGCGPCNKEFSNLLEQNKKNDQVISLVTASGTKIDLSSLNSDKVYFDPDTDNPNFQKTGVIFFKDESIDTIVLIDARSLENTNKFIKDKLSIFHKRV